VALVLSDAGPRLRWLLQLAAWMLHECCMDAAWMLLMLVLVVMCVCLSRIICPSVLVQHGRSRLCKTGPAMYSAEVLS